MNIQKSHLLQKRTVLWIFLLLYLALSFLFASPKTPFLIFRLILTPLAHPLLIPVQGLQPKNLVDTWGAARSGGRTHKGIDLFAPKGTPVLSATEGIVFQVGTDRLGGQVVRVLGPRATLHYYAHLSAYGNVRRGDWVTAGEILGYVGNTGNAATTPPHLHYGIYYFFGKATNPYPYLTRKRF